MKDGFSERTALRQCTLFPKLQVQRQPPATGCVSWDLAQLACVKVFPVPIRDLVFSPDFNFKLPSYQPTGIASNYFSSPGRLKFKEIQLEWVSLVTSARPFLL